MAQSNVPILYGVPFSQPVRAVMWLLLHKRSPFEMVPINPGSKGRSGSRNPVYLAKNPGGTIPCWEEPDTGFVLAEAHAILVYLCRKHQWSDLYPTDIQRAARIDWYLNYHHRNIRDASVGMVAPRVRKDLNIPQERQQVAKNTFTAGLNALEAGWLRNSRYLAGDSPTIADLAAYVEIGQLQPRFTNIYDFEPFPNVRRWLADMAEMDGHDAAHATLTELGDISAEPPSMEAIVGANKQGLGVLKEQLAQFR